MLGMNTGRRTPDVSARISLGVTASVAMLRRIAIRRIPLMAESGCAYLSANSTDLSIRASSLTPTMPFCRANGRSALGAGLCLGTSSVLPYVLENIVEYESFFTARSALARIIIYASRFASRLGNEIFAILILNIEFMYVLNVII